MARKQNTFYRLVVTDLATLRIATGRKRLTDAQAKAIMARVEDILTEDYEFSLLVDGAIDLAVVDWDQTN